MRARAAAALFVSLFAASLGLSAIGAPAALAAGGSKVVTAVADPHISGTVTNAVGAPLAGISVSAVGSTTVNGTTSATGTYDLSVPADSYSVHFSDGTGSYAAGYYSVGQWGNWSTNVVTAVDVSSADATGIDVTMPVAFDISGTVVHSATPLAGIGVTVYSGGGALIVATGTTAADGTFSIPVAVGVYQVGFDGGSTYASGAWDGSGFSPDPMDYGDVTVLAAVGGIDVDLPLHIGPPTNVTGVARVQGARVTWDAPTEDGGAPIAGYHVRALQSGMGTTVFGECYAIAPALSCIVNGLDDGTEYFFRVDASNAYATSATADSNAVTPTVAVGQPLFVGGTPGDGEATISWEAPLDSPGGDLTGFLVDDSTHTFQCTGGAADTSCDVSGLTNGTEYIFTVSATFTAGGPIDSDPVYVTPATVPGPPTGVQAEPGDGSVVVSWTPPASDGGNPVQGYQVADTGTGTHTCMTARDSGDPLHTPANSCEVDGLTNGTLYTFNVVAGNSIGGSTPSGTASATPDVAPNAPQNVAATAGNGTATVTWSAPTPNGGSAIVEYDVTSSPGALGCTWATGPLSCMFSNLPNGQTFTFTVVAKNRVLGTDSAPSNAVTPATTPGAPLSPTAVGGDASATVSWSAPTSNGGSAITAYNVVSTPDSKTCSTTGALSCSVSGLTNGTSYTFKVTPTNSVGPGTTSAASNSVTPEAAPPTTSTYHPITPVRLLDTRYANGHSGKITANTPMTFQVTGRTDQGNPVPSGASAVTGNLTVTESSGPWAIYLGPTPIASPSSSTINFTTGQTIANGLTVALSGSGSLSATYLGPAGAKTSLVFDVTGYYTPDTSGQTFHPIAPVRDVDTRIPKGLSGKLTAKVPACFTVANVNGVPSDAKAVTGNVTVTNPTSAWALYLGPLNTATPTTSTLNFLANQVASNNVTVALDGSGKLCATYLGPTGATTHLVFDVTGYFTDDATGASFVPIDPVRLLDTRHNNGLNGKFVVGTPRTFAVTGRGTIPTGAAAVTGNLTVTDENAGWAIYIGPDPLTTPPASSLNFVLGDVKANGVSVALSGTGTLSPTYLGPVGATTSLVFDCTGYFVLPTP